MSPPPDFHPEAVTATQMTGRRVQMITFVVIVTGLAALLMADLLWGMPLADWGAVSWVLFVLLFAQIAFGFAQAFFGFLVRRRPGRRQTIDQSLPADESTVPLAPTAIIMPIYNEEVGRVYAGLRATYVSVARTGQGGQFDFFILSDSTDPDIWVEEEMGWVALARELNARGRIFYRRRRVHANKKAGNIADFCRRWGRRYRYMVVLDADSVMQGETLVRMVRMMERNPATGLIQTAPQLIRGETLFARVLQFAARLYGPIFREGMNYWQQGEGNYWGHNAIIRVAPFVAHCALPTLPGREPFGGRILSHDFVEAALLRRAGWAVWLWPDATGSYEEGPANLIDYAKRDRRWCQGNLQHFWLVFARQLRGVSRIHLSLGIFSYASSLVWLVSLVLGSLLIIGFNRTGLSWLPTPGLAEALGLGMQTSLLVGLTVVLLFGPKVLAVIDQLRQPEGARPFGGLKPMLIGVAWESLFSILLAPVLMLFHAQFVVATVLGQGVHWVTQRRGGGEDNPTGWREARTVLRGHTAAGVIWLGVLLAFAPSLVWWMLPLLVGLVGAIPFAVWTGRTSLGRAARARGWLATPEELAPPVELTELAAAESNRTDNPPPAVADGRDAGLIRVVLDPYVNAVHRCLLRDRPDRSPVITRYFFRMQEKLLREGPAALSPREKVALLSDAASVDRLHLQAWLRPAEEIAPCWQAFLAAYAPVAPGEPG
jgi:membrane glycosyltransferase